MLEDTSVGSCSGPGAQAQKDYFSSSFSPFPSLPPPFSLFLFVVVLFCFKNRTRKAEGKEEGNENIKHKLFTEFFI